MPTHDIDGSEIIRSARDAQPAIYGEWLAALMECDRLRKLAHEAPLNPLRTDHDGHRWIEPQSEAWRHRVNEWMAACDRAHAIKGRLLTQYMAGEMRKALGQPPIVG